jgi:hypothetical protein
MPRPSTAEVSVAPSSTPANTTLKGAPKAAAAARVRRSAAGSERACMLVDSAVSPEWPAVWHVHGHVRERQDHRCR